MPNKDEQEKIQQPDIASILAPPSWSQAAETWTPKTNTEIQNIVSTAEQKGEIVRNDTGAYEATPKLQQEADDFRISNRDNDVSSLLASQALTPQKALKIAEEYNNTGRDLEFLKSEVKEAERNAANPTEIKRQNKSFKLDKHAWADTEGTTGKKRNETNPDDDAYHWDGHTDENGNWVSGLAEWAEDNDARLTATENGAFSEKFQTEEEIQGLQQEAANLYYDNSELEDYVQKMVDDFKAEYDANYASASEEDKKKWDEDLANKEGYLAYVTNMKDRSKQAYDALVSKNDFYGGFDKKTDVEAYVNDPENYGVMIIGGQEIYGGGNTPEALKERQDYYKKEASRLQTEIDAEVGWATTEAQNEEVQSKKDKADKYRQAVEDLDDDIKLAEARSQMLRNKAEEENRNREIGKNYIFIKDEDGSLRTYNEQDWRNVEAQIYDQMKGLDVNSEAYKDLDNNLKFIQQQLGSSILEELTEKWKGASVEDMQKRYSELLDIVAPQAAPETASKPVAKTEKPKTGADKRNALIAEQNKLDITNDDDYKRYQEIEAELRALDTEEVLDEQQEETQKVDTPVGRELTYAEELEAGYLLQQLNEANDKEREKTYEKEFGKLGVTDAFNKASGDLNDLLQTMSATDDTKVSMMSGFIRGSTAAFSGGDFYMPGLRTASDSYEEWAKEERANAEAKIGQAYYNYAKAKENMDVDLKKAADYTEKVNQGKKNVADVSALRDAFTTVNNLVLGDSKSQLKEHESYAKSVLAKVGIEGAEADEVLKMLTASGFDVRYLTPTSEALDADKDPNHKLAYGETLGFFTEDETNNFYYLWEKEGAASALRYALGINNILNSDYKEMIRENRAQITGYKAKYEKDRFFIDAMAAGAYTGLMQMTAPIDFINTASQVKALGSEVVAPTFTVAELGNTINEIYTEKIADAVPNPTLANLAQFAYSVYGSTMQSLETQWIGGGLASLLGTSMASPVTGAAHKAIAGMFSDLTFLSSAAMNSYRDFRKRGVDVNSAWTAAVLAGVAEAGFEHLSFDKLYEARSVTHWVDWRDYVSNLIISAGIEGSEEVFTSMANYLTETNILGPNSSYWRSVDNYMINYGLSRDDAMRKAFGDTVQSWGMDFLAGSISGGVAVGGRSAIWYNQYKHESQDLAKRIGVRINQPAEDGGKTLAQKLGEYYSQYEFFKDTDPIRPTKAMEKTVERIKEIAEKAKAGTATDEELGELAYNAKRIARDSYYDFIKDNLQEWFAVSGGDTAAAAEEAMIALYGEEGVNAFRQAVAANPNAFVADDFVAGLKQQGIDIDTARKIEQNLGLILTGSNARNESQIKSLIKETFKNKTVQKYVISYLSDVIDKNTPKQGLFGLLRGTNPRAANAAPWVTLTSKGALEGNFSQALVGIWSTVKEAKRYNNLIINGRFRAMEEQRQIESSESSLRNAKEVNDHMSEFRSDNDEIVINGRTHTRAEFIDAAKKGLNPLTREPMQGAKISTEQANIYFDSVMRRALSPDAIFDDPVLNALVKVSAKMERQAEWEAKYGTQTDGGNNTNAESGNSTTPASSPSGGTATVGGSGSSTATVQNNAGGTDGSTETSDSFTGKSRKNAEKLIKKFGVTLNGDYVLDTDGLTADDIRAMEGLTDAMKDRIISALESGVGRIIITKGEMRNRNGSNINGVADRINGKFCIAVNVLSRDGVSQARAMDLATRGLEHEYVHYMLKLMPQGIKRSFLNLAIETAFAGRKDLYQTVFKAAVLAGYSQYGTVVNGAVTLTPELITRIDEEIVADIYSRLLFFNYSSGINTEDGGVGENFAAFMREASRNLRTLIEDIGLPQYAKNRNVKGQTDIENRPEIEDFKKRGKLAFGIKAGQQIELPYTIKEIAAKMSEFRKDLRNLTDAEFEQLEQMYDSYEFEEGTRARQEFDAAKLEVIAEHERRAQLKNTPPATQSTDTNTQETKAEQKPAERTAVNNMTVETEDDFKAVENTLMKLKNKESFYFNYKDRQYVIQVDESKDWGSVYKIGLTHNGQLWSVVPITQVATAKEALDFIRARHAENGAADTTGQQTPEDMKARQHLDFLKSHQSLGTDEDTLKSWMSAITDSQLAALVKLEAEDELDKKFIEAAKKEIDRRATENSATPEEAGAQNAGFKDTATPEQLAIRKAEQERLAAVLREEEDRMASVQNEQEQLAKDQDKPKKKRQKKENAEKKPVKEKVLVDANLETEENLRASETNGKFVKNRRWGNKITNPVDGQPITRAEFVKKTTEGYPELDEIGYPAQMTVAEANDLFDELRYTEEHPHNSAYSILNNVVDINGRTYSQVALLDKTLPNRLIRNDRAFNQFVQDNLSGAVLGTVSDYGIFETIEFANADDEITKGKYTRPVLSELTYGNRPSKQKRLVYLNAEDVVEISDFRRYKERDADESETHEWLDQNGFEVRTGYVMTNNTLYPVRLYIAQAADGRSILYFADVEKSKSVAVDAEATAQNNPGVDLTRTTQFGYSHDSSTDDNTIAQNEEEIKLENVDIEGDSPMAEAFRRALAAKFPEQKGVDQIDESYSLAGPNALAADLGRLDTAMDMEVHGYSADDIWLATGWFRGMDGKWKWEIYDKDIRLDRDALRKNLLRNDVLEKYNRDSNSLTEEEQAILTGDRNTRVRFAYKLNEFLTGADELFNNYPELNKVAVVFVTKDEPKRGEAIFANNTIEINLSAIKQLANGNWNVIGSTTKGTLLHEIQHYIQRYEHFAQGASVGYWENQIKNEPDELVPTIGMDAGARLYNVWKRKLGEDGYNQLYDLAALREEALEGNTSLETYDQALDDNIEQFTLPVVSSFLHDVAVYSENYPYTDYLRTQNAFDLYARTAGEVEARDVQNRRNLSEEDRAKAKPFTTPKAVINSSIFSFDSDAFEETAKTHNDIANAEQQFSLLNENYLNAVESGDTEEAKRLIAEAAKAAGYTLHGYHGTQRGDRVGNRFIPSRATSGPMAFFTSERHIAETYARDKRDTSLDYEDWYSDPYLQYTVERNGKTIPVGDLWKTMSAAQKRAITERASHITFDDAAENIIYNPDVKYGVGNFDQYLLREHKGNVINALISSWIMDGNIEGNQFLEVLDLVGINDASFRDPDERHEKVYDVYIKISNPFNAVEADEDFISGLEEWYAQQDPEKYNRTGGNDPWDKNNWPLDRWIDKLRDDIAQGTSGAWTSIPDSVTDYLKSLGYDGIIDQGGKFYEEGIGSYVYIPFTGEQVKSADIEYDDNGNLIPLSERFNPENDDIRYSISNFDHEVTVEEVQEARDRWMSLKTAIDERKEELNAQTNRAYKGDITLDEYKTWLRESGYEDAYKTEREAWEEYNRLNKLYNEQYDLREEEKERQAIADSGLTEAEYFAKKAVKEFGYTPYFYDAGYMLPNGKMLNFSGEKGKHFGSRGEDHRGIETIFATTRRGEALTRFVNYGNVRVMPEGPGLEISTLVEPTAEQYSKIRDFIRQYQREGYFNIDLADEKGYTVGTLEYEDNINLTRIVNDLKTFYRTGEVPQQSTVSQFHEAWSLQGNPTEVTQEDVETLLENVINGEYNDDTYIPVRINTPLWYIYQVGKDSKGEIVIKDLPMVASVGKLRQAMEAYEGRDMQGGKTPHELSSYDIISAIKEMNDPSYIVRQKNGRYAEVVSFYSERSRKTVLAVIELYSDTRNEQVMNNFNPGVYNTLITLYEPTDLKKYLSTPQTAVIWDKKNKGTLPGGEARVMSLALKQNPFYTDNIAQETPEVKSKNANTEQYSLLPVDPVLPTSAEWTRTIDTAEAKERFPELWDVSADESEVRNPTQIKSTVSTYRKIYDILKDEGFNGTILDASSGLGYGTRAGIDEYGFNVDDIEPYPDRSYKPKYTDYSALNNKYDVIISNAVLNVLPQDQRDALVVKMGQLLNPGGRMFINVRSANDVKQLAKNASNVVIGNNDYYVSGTGSYQKGFTKNELKAYLQDALGPGYDVAITNKFGDSSVIVTKAGASTEQFSLNVGDVVNIEDVSKEIANLDTERYYIISPEGEVLYKQEEGAHGSVSVSVGTKREYLSGNISVHNHPEGGTFSAPDLRDFGYGARQIFAVSPGGIFNLSNDKFGTREQFDGWLDMQEALLQEVPQEVSDYALMKAARENTKDTPEAQRMREITQEWVRRKDAGASNEELIEFVNASGYDDLVKRQKEITAEEKRYLEVEPQNKWFEENAKNYGFTYSFEPNSSTARFSISANPDATFDAFGDEVQLDNYNLTNLTPSELSDKLYYSSNGNTAYYQTDFGETVVLNNVGTDSLEARYINYLEAINHANGTDTTATKPHTIPVATRNEADGYNLREQDAGLRRGQEEVSAQNQEGAFRRTGSTSERNAESRPQSAQAEGVNESYSIFFGEDFVNGFGDEDFIITDENDNFIGTGSEYDRDTQALLRAIRDGEVGDLEEAIRKMFKNREGDLEDAYQELLDLIEQNDGLTEEQKAERKKAAEEAVKKYGGFKAKKGDKNPQNRAIIPKKSDANTKTRRFVATAAANTNDELAGKLAQDTMTDELLGYVPQSNKTTMDKAETMLKSTFGGSLDRAASYLHTKVEAGEMPTAVDIALGDILIMEYSNDKSDPGGLAKATRVTADLAILGTNGGQFIQAMSLIKKATPKGQLYYLNGVINQLNRMYANRIQSGKMGTIELKDALAMQLLAASTRDEMNKVIEIIKDDLANQIPPTLSDRWNAWRYLAMLGNPRTHIRNIFGNAMFIPAVMLKDVFATALEQNAKWIDPSARVHKLGAGFNINSEYWKYAANDYKATKDVLKGKKTGNKYSDINDIISRRKVFKDIPIIGEALQKVNDANSNALEGEDAGFQWLYYVHYLSEFLEAKGIKESELGKLTSTKDGKAILNQGRAWAAQQARRDTYHEANALSMAINRLKHTNNVSYTLVDGVVPFVGTPANIMILGAIDYTPIGLIKGAVELNKLIKAGDRVHTNQAIDRMAAGLSGTAIMALGFAFRALGFLRGLGPDDDDLRELESQQGHQNWSVEIGDYSYTIDWMAPAALPLFTGVTVYDVLNGTLDFSNPETLYTAALGMANPMFALSMLDGLESVLSDLRKANNGAEAIALFIGSSLASYAAQTVPTIGGQFARTLDPVRRDSVYIDKNSKVPGALQTFIQKSVQAKTPKWVEKKTAYIDRWGREERTDSFLMRAFQNFLSPGYLKHIDEDPVDAELVKLYNEIGGDDASKVLPKYLRKDISNIVLGKDDNGEEIVVPGKDLTAKEYEQLRRVTGQTRHQILFDIFNDELYQNATTTEKLKMVVDAYDYGLDIGKRSIIPERGLGSKWMNVAEKIGPADYILIRQEYEENKSNDKIFSWIVDNPNLNTNQMAALFADKFSTPDYIDSAVTGYRYKMQNSDDEPLKEMYEINLRAALPALYNDKNFMNAEPDERADLLKEFVTEIKDDTLTGYSTMLSTTDRVFTLGPATKLGKEKFEVALDAYDGDHLKQGQWIAQAYKPDKTIAILDKDGNPTGYEFELSDQEREKSGWLYKTVYERYSQAYDDMWAHNEEFKKAVARNDKTAMSAIAGDLYTEIVNQVENEYARELDSKGVAKSFKTSPTGLNTETAFSIAKGHYGTDYEAIGKYVAQTRDNSTTLKDPDNPGHVLVLSTAQGIQAKKDFDEMFTAALVAESKKDYFQGLSEKDQEAVVKGLMNQVNAEFEIEYARKLKAAGIANDQIKLDSPVDDLLKLIENEKYSKEQTIDILVAKYEKDIDIGDNWEVRKLRSRFFRDYLVANYDSVVKNGTAEELDALRGSQYKGAMKYANDNVKKHYGLSTKDALGKIPAWEYSIPAINSAFASNTGTVVTPEQSKSSTGYVTPPNKGILTNSWEEIQAINEARGDNYDLGTGPISQEEYEDEYRIKGFEAPHTGDVRSLVRTSMDNDAVWEAASEALQELPHNYEAMNGYEDVAFDIAQEYYTAWLENPDYYGQTFEDWLAQNPDNTDTYQRKYTGTGQKATRREALNYSVAQAVGGTTYAKKMQNRGNFWAGLIRH